MPGKVVVSARAKALLALVLGVVAISWSAIFVRWTGMPGVASAFWRVLIASAALWAVLGLRGRPRVSRGVLPLAVLGGVFFSADVGLYNVAVLHTAAGSATFLGNNAPLAVGLMTWLVTRRLPGMRFWVALVIALLGAGLIVAVDFGHARSASGADLLAALAAVCFAGYLMATERLRMGADTVMLVALSSAVSALALGLFALATGVSLRVPGAQAWAAVLGLGLVCQVAGYLSLTYALGHLPATVSSVVLLAVAPLTAVLALVLFHEAMTPVQMLGGGLILAAIWIVTGESRMREVADFA